MMRRVIGPEEQAAADRNLAEREVATRRGEQVAWEQQARRELADRYRSGAPTARMQRALDRVQALTTVLQGRWAPHNEAGASWGTSLDGGRALQLASTAAERAVNGVIQPLIAEAEIELKDATAERDKLARGGR